MPRVLVGDGRAFYEGLGDLSDEEGVIVGSPVSPGTVEGIVRVVLDPAHSGLRHGEILVCPGTDPAWTPLFLSAGGPGHRGRRHDDARLGRRPRVRHPGRRRRPRGDHPARHRPAGPRWTGPPARSSCWTTRPRTPTARADRRADRRLASEGDPSGGSGPHRDRPRRAAVRHRLRRVPRGGRLVGPPAPLRGVRPRRLLRHLARPARHGPLPRDRPSDDPRASNPARSGSSTTARRGWSNGPELAPPAVPPGVTAGSGARGPGPGRLAGPPELTGVRRRERRVTLGDGYASGRRRTPPHRSARRRVHQRSPGRPGDLRPDRRGAEPVGDHEYDHHHRAPHHDDTRADTRRRPRRRRSRPRRSSPRPTTAAT